MFTAACVCSLLHNDTGIVLGIHINIYDFTCNWSYKKERCKCCVDEWGDTIGHGFIKKTKMDREEGEENKQCKPNNILIKKNKNYNIPPTKKAKVTIKCSMEDPGQLRFPFRTPPKKTAQGRAQKAVPHRFRVRGCATIALKFSRQLLVNKDRAVPQNQKSKSNTQPAYFLHLSLSLFSNLKKKRTSSLVIVVFLLNHKLVSSPSGRSRFPFIGT